MTHETAAVPAGAELAARIAPRLLAREQVLRPDRAPAALLIDGRSGSGKTTLAAAIAVELGGDVLHLDELYPGWDGLAAGSLAVAEALAAGGYRSYDWARERFEGWTAIDPLRPLVVEGCGALTAANLAAARDHARGLSSVGDAARRAVWGVWLDCPTALRRERALRRDGETFAPYWEQWALQEEAHYAAAHPISLADEVVRSGDPSAAT